MIKVGVFALLATMSLFYGLHACGATVAYRVNYDGKIIATVKSKQQFSEAMDIVKERVNLVDNDKVEEIVSTPVYTTALVLNDVIDSDAVLADAIIENTENIVYASSLIINGETVACVEQTALTECINNRLNQFNIPDTECKTEFTDDVSFDNGYFLLDKLDSIDYVSGLISSLDVRTVVTNTSDIETDYKTVTKTTDEKTVDYLEVETEGQKGIRRITENVVLINGLETERQQISDEVIKEPVDEVIIKGTAKNRASAEEKSIAKKSGFVFPLPKGVWQVSAYYGDGRGHKGIDLRSPKGTSIYAVAGGKVTFASYYKGYGNCVKIDHGNGLITVYAHASKLCVSVGDTVSAGDIIALVGCTGDSSGNHLHFEVISGNKNINPAPFIGIN